MNADVVVVGRAQVDEDALFRMVEQMRMITGTATKTTRRARRDEQRRTSTPPPRVPAPGPVPPPDPPADTAPAASALPFADIEQW
ncbi:hypothetical protein [Virgisporangium aurantiacum]|uniref:hypothetical protein n=1 Tax=Virgisporangium aurantiacum TaxID=175570 RepID=UPI00194E9E8F|nr:hypothetical protein [Virgisporangium aurantiacum]